MITFRAGTKGSLEILGSFKSPSFRILTKCCKLLISFQKLCCICDRSAIGLYFEFKVIESKQFWWQTFEFNNSPQVSGPRTHVQVLNLWCILERCSKLFKPRQFLSFKEGLHFATRSNPCERGSISGRLSRVYPGFVTSGSLLYARARTMLYKAYMLPVWQVP